MASSGAAKRIVLIVEGEEGALSSTVPGIQFVQFPAPRGGLPTVYGLQHSTKVYYIHISIRN